MSEIVQEDTETTPEEVVQLAGIVTAMSKAGLDAPFLAAAQELARRSRGVFHLMELWGTASSDEERDQVIADVQEALDDESSNAPREMPKIDYKHLDTVGKSVAAHKKKLRDIIDRHGGVTKVAKECGIPQPSLSRMLSSGSMPRRTTLYKIAKALDLDETEIVGEYTR